MKVKCEIILNGEEKKYEIKFYNLSNPGVPVSYGDVRDILHKVFQDIDRQVEETGINSNDQVVKMIH